MINSAWKGTFAVYVCADIFDEIIQILTCSDYVMFMRAIVLLTARMQVIIVMPMEKTIVMDGDGGWINYEYGQGGHFQRKTSGREIAI